MRSLLYSNRKIAFLGLGGLLLALVAANRLIIPILAAPEAESLEKWVISNGGGTTLSDGIETFGVIGQPVIDKLSANGASVESGFRTSADFPTAVTIANFTVLAQTRSTAIITWKTSFESNLIGFRLYRTNSGNQLLVCITDEPIPAQSLGGIAGNIYTYVDPGLQSGEHYIYTLEAIHTNQPITRYTSAEIIIPTDILYFPVIQH